MARPQPQAGATAARRGPPGRHQHPVAALLQYPGVFPQEVERLPPVQGDPHRPLGGQPRPQRRDHPRRLADLEQELLGQLAAQAAGHRGLGRACQLPIVGQGQHKARVLARCRQPLQIPGVGPVRRGLLQAEAELEAVGALAPLQAAAPALPVLPGFQVRGFRGATGGAADQRRGKEGPGNCLEGLLRELGPGHQGLVGLLGEAPQQGLGVAQGWGELWERRLGLAGGGITQGAAEPGHGRGELGDVRLVVGRERQPAGGEPQGQLRLLATAGRGGRCRRGPGKERRQKGLTSHQVPHRPAEAVPEAQVAAQAQAVLLLDGLEVQLFEQQQRVRGGHRRHLPGAPVERLRRLGPQQLPQLGGGQGGPVRRGQPGPDRRCRRLDGPQRRGREDLREQCLQPRGGCRDGMRARRLAPAQRLKLFHPEDEPAGVLE